MSQTKHSFNGLGSPKDIEEMITHILCYRPPEGKTPQDWVRGIFRDYLAQKFGVAMMNCHTPEQEALLEDLWFRLTGEKNWGRTP